MFYDEYVLNPDYTPYLLKEFTAKRPNSKIIWIRSSRGNGKSSKLSEEIVDYLESNPNVTIIDVKDVGGK